MYRKWDLDTYSLSYEAGMAIASVAVRNQIIEKYFQSCSEWETHAVPQFPAPHTSRLSMATLSPSTVVTSLLLCSILKLPSWGIWDICATFTPRGGLKQETFFSDLDPRWQGCLPPKLLEGSCLLVQPWQLQIIDGQEVPYSASTPFYIAFHVCPLQLLRDPCLGRAGNELWSRS